jgi:hypothetical protein
MRRALPSGSPVAVSTTLLVSCRERPRHLATRPRRDLLPFCGYFTATPAAGSAPHTRTAGPDSWWNLILAHRREETDDRPLWTVRRSPAAPPRAPRGPRREPRPLGCCRWYREGAACVHRASRGSSSYSSARWRSPAAPRPREVPRPGQSGHRPARPHRRRVQPHPPRPTHPRAGRRPRPVGRRRPPVPTSQRDRRRRGATWPIFSSGRRPASAAARPCPGRCC